jgi:hypothetical protein
VPPSSCVPPTASPNATAPVAAPTSGSRLTNAPATSAETRVCAHANSEKASAVPTSASATTATTGVGVASAAGAPSTRIANGSAATPPAPS